MNSFVICEGSLYKKQEDGTITKIEEFENFNFEYLHGKCHLFALVLHEIFGCDLEFAWDTEAEFESDEGIVYGLGLIHAYCVRPDGSLVDASGSITYEDVQNDYGDWNNLIFEKHEKEEVFDFIKQNMLVPFEEGEKQKIKQHIEKYKFVYQ